MPDYCECCGETIDPVNGCPNGCDTRNYCECCNHTPCVCDRDDNNPVDCSREWWQEFYATNPDFEIGDDHSMDY